jgi:hypothetical protein
VDTQHFREATAMSSRQFNCALRVVCATLALFAITARAQTAKPNHSSYRVAAIRAMLFYTDSGTFSPDLLTYKGLINLWNVPANQRADHEIGGPSNATLVVIEIRGPSDSYIPNRRVDFRATTAKKVLSHRSSDIYLSGTGVGYLAFWLTDTGCEPIQLSARLIGQAEASRQSAEIPFHCGE